VCQVPFWRTGIGHALQAQVLRLQPCDELFAGLAHRQQIIKT
jgi:hypothetical protein